MNLSGVIYCEMEQVENGYLHAGLKELNRVKV